MSYTKRKRPNRRETPKEDTAKEELIKSEFITKVYETVASIPLGKVATYGQIARICGKPRSAREVGWAMRNCPEVLPWQRVVMADGSITGGRHAEARKALLISEGVPVADNGRVDMKAHQWDA